jgi:hypothetical protein
MKDNHRYLPLICAVAAVACAGSSELQPAAGARGLRGVENAAVSCSNGVQVTAQIASWPSDANADRMVTPLRIIVQNEAREPVLVRYADFTLETSAGKQYPSPPLRVEDRHANLEFSAHTASPVRANILYKAFRVAPQYRMHYRGLVPYDGPFDHDSSYYDAHYGDWGTSTLPTNEMISRALPEGVVDPGGYVAGYLYFPKVKSSARMVLHASLPGAKSGEVAGMVALPFTTAARASTL